MPEPDSIPKVFLCYAREDNDNADALRGGPWLDRLRRQLGQYEKAGVFSVFSDLNINPGDPWDAEILRRLNEASVVVVLVSDALLNSSYVRDREMPIILARAAAGELQVVPLVLNHCDPDGVPFPFLDKSGEKQSKRLTEFQTLGTPDNPLIGLTVPEQNQLLFRVAQAVKEKARAKKAAAAAQSLPPSSLPPETSSVQTSSADSRTTTLGFTNSLGMEFVPVPGTEVRFCIWPTRVQDYAAFAEAHPDLDRSWKDPVFNDVPVTPGPTYPVVNVSWDDAKRFCEWLTERDQGQKLIRKTQYYRLPTDLEWSAAVDLRKEVGETPKDRHGKVFGVYPWGNQWPPPHGAGNFADESARLKFSEWKTIPGYRDGYATTSPVGEFRASKDGVFDLSGNVLEWCEDFYNGNSGNRVLRGGSWYIVGPSGLLSSYRTGVGPGVRNDGIGFRVVLVGDESAR